MIDRRAFLAGAGVVLLAAPLAAEAQEAGKVYRCAGRMELMATIDAPAVIARAIAHLGLPGSR